MPTTPANRTFVVSSVRTGPGGAVKYEIVTAGLQRMYVAVPRQHTDNATALDVIGHAIDAVYAPGKPLHATER